jgi:hypothetical protein
LPEPDRGQTGPMAWWLTNGLLDSPPSPTTWPHSFPSSPVLPALPDVGDLLDPRYPWWLTSATQPMLPLGHPVEWPIPPGAVPPTPASPSEGDSENPAPVWMDSAMHPPSPFGPPDPTQWPDPSSRSLPDVGSNSGDPYTSWIESLAYPRSPVFDDGEANGTTWDYAGTDDTSAEDLERLGHSLRPQRGRMELVGAVLQELLLRYRQSLVDLLVPFTETVPQPRGALAYRLERVSRERTAYRGISRRSRVARRSDEAPDVGARNGAHDGRLWTAAQQCTTRRDRCVRWSKGIWTHL